MIALRRILVPTDCAVRPGDSDLPAGADTAGRNPPPGILGVQWRGWISDCLLARLKSIVQLMGWTLTSSVRPGTGGWQLEVDMTTRERERETT